MTNVPSSDRNKPACCCGGNASGDATARRGFFAKTAAIVLGAASLATPVVVGLFSFLQPLRQKQRGGEFYRVTTLANVPEDGTPARFPVIADRKDAWTLYENVPIGSVFLRRTNNNEVVALSVICPHAGCFIGYDAKTKGFLCPCHMAYFDIDGRRTDADSKSPRDMDTLPGVEIRRGEVWVRYEKFRMGISRKVAES
ncbi:MAG: Rieske 2Fe-2S domain-containing protein [Pirellulaceae bacterium]|nr:Rieske 2Fe-2S domain-containing protein [Pirellulaceae bacterium]